MGINKPKDGAPGTTDQSPRWEGPKGNRPRDWDINFDESEPDRSR